MAAGTITLQGPPESTVSRDVDRLNKAFDLIGQREKVRQDRQQINDFVQETIRLQGESPNLTGEEVFQLATKNVLAKGPQFSGGIAGFAQKFASGFTGGPSTALTGPLAERAFNEPTGIRRDLIKSQIESNAALATQRKEGRTGRTIRPTQPDPVKQDRDKDIKIIEDEDATILQKGDAIERLNTLHGLIDATASKDDLDVEFKNAMEDVKSKKLKGDILDKRFGSEAYAEGLENAIKLGLEEGVRPASVTEAFNKWWDEQFAKEKGETFQKFQDRAEFMDVTGTATADDIGAKIEAALKAGKINEQDKKDAIKALELNPDNAAEILKRLGQ